MLSAAIDPVVHAALVTLAVWFIHWLFGLLNIELGNETAQALAEILVGYILSLFGWSLWFSTKIKAFKSTPSYKPPFT